jgi:hypothetical protein
VGKFETSAAEEFFKPSFGGASRDRTDDLIVANDALSQLSYSPKPDQFLAEAKPFYQSFPVPTTRRGTIVSTFHQKILDEPAHRSSNL